MIKSDNELQEILIDFYACTRVWEAWSYGTMTENDFEPLGESVEAIHDFTMWRNQAVIAELEQVAGLLHESQQELLGHIEDRIAKLRCVV